MSHLKQRRETNCLNCGTEVQGRYCHQCGQENIEPKETVWHLVSHFFQDITHFDGKFFSTIGLLIKRPGFLSKEYMVGRRASYLNPIRLYVFTSAFFFLIFFSFFNSEGGHMTTTVNGKAIDQIDKMDSAEFAEFTRVINANNQKAAVPMTREEFQHYLDSAINHGTIVRIGDIRYASREEYDSLLRTGARKDNWFFRRITYKMIDINVKYKNNIRGFWEAFREHILHSLPQMLFVSLPFLALLLQLLYIRRRKQFYYVNHAIWGIHVYVVIFISLLLIMSFSSLGDWLGWQLFHYLNVLLTIGIFLYTYLAMKWFYGQGWGKTFAKYILLLISFMFLLVLLIMFFAFFSLLTL